MTQFLVTSLIYPFISYVGCSGQVMVRILDAKAEILVGKSAADSKLEGLYRSIHQRQINQSGEKLSMFLRVYTSILG